MPQETEEETEEEEEEEDEGTAEEDSGEDVVVEGEAVDEERQSGDGEVREIVFMPPTLKKLMGHIAFGACVGHTFCTYCNF